MHHSQNLMASFSTHLEKTKYLSKSCRSDLNRIQEQSYVTSQTLLPIKVSLEVMETHPTGNLLDYLWSQSLHIHIFFKQAFERQQSSSVTASAAFHEERRHQITSIRSRPQMRTRTPAGLSLRGSSARPGGAQQRPTDV